MPRYDFRCTSCNEEFDTYQTLEKRDSTTCVKCGETARRIFKSSSPVIFRPDGWNLRPDEPGYSNLPRTDRTIHSWQQN